MNAHYPEREQARHGQYENEPTIVARAEINLLNLCLARRRKSEAQHEARMREQQLHGWSRAKKEALIRGDIETLKQLSKKKDLS